MKASVSADTKIPESGRCVFSDCKDHRFELWREWGTPEQGFVQFVGLNPSTADTSKSDPTVRRCCNFAKAWGHGAMVMTNLFSLRSTDPKALKTAKNPNLFANDQHLVDVMGRAAKVVVAWGAHGKLYHRQAHFMRLVREWHPNITLWAFGFTSGGCPLHPLYLPNNIELVPFFKDGLVLNGK